MTSIKVTEKKYIIKQGSGKTIIKREVSHRIVKHGIPGPPGAPGPIGPIGPQGPQGEGDKAYTHTQNAPALTWVINHNLGKYPAVDVVDSAGTTFIGDVNYTSINTLEINFSAEFSGQAFLN